MKHLSSGLFVLLAIAALSSSALAKGPESPISIASTTVTASARGFDLDLHLAVNHHAIAREHGTALTSTEELQVVPSLPEGVSAERDLLQFDIPAEAEHVHIRIPLQADRDGVYRIHLSIALRRGSTTVRMAQALIWVERVGSQYAIVDYARWLIWARQRYGKSLDLPVDFESPNADEREAPALHR